LVSEPGKLLKRYASEFDIQAVQAVVQVAIKVAEEYLPGEEELSEALRNLFFERAEEAIIQEEQERIKLWLLLLRFEEVSAHL
jgi:hypothetical protein